VREGRVWSTRSLIVRIATTISCGGLTDTVGAPERGVRGGGRETVTGGGGRRQFSALDLSGSEVVEARGGGVVALVRGRGGEGANQQRRHQRPRRQRAAPGGQTEEGVGGAHREKARAPLDTGAGGRKGPGEGVEGERDPGEGKGSLEDEGRERHRWYSGR
jgi:hypothetical protein